MFNICIILLILECYTSQDDGGTYTNVRTEDGRYAYEYYYLENGDIEYYDVDVYGDGMIQNLPKYKLDEKGTPIKKTTPEQDIKNLTIKMLFQIQTYSAIVNIAKIAKFNRFLVLPLQMQYF